MRWQYEDYFGDKHERGFQRLLVSLKRRADSLGLQTDSVGRDFIPTNKVNEEPVSAKKERYSKTYSK
ncbi:MAG: hypothetical protein UZ14_CFX002003017 [Chloroflexi bacterium OLB14]|nr:MAG: hypothetical protein UZ14_CFX002003017 [Chloroflexi bacterium OLB14]